MRFKTLELTQNTLEWHRWRSDGIGRSDAVVIDGWTRYKTLEQLIDEKVYRQVNTPITADALHGQRDETTARLALEKRLGIRLSTPTCVQNTTYEWLRASLDCADFSRNFICEIKCGRNQFFQHEGSRAVVPWISIQVQHALAVTGFEYGYIWFWNAELGSIKRIVKRNRRVIEKLIDREQQVWFEVQKRRKSLVI